MSDPKLNAHGSDIVRNLFEENTNEVKTVGDIIEKHSGDSLILTHTTRGNRSADEGESDFEEDVLPTDPSEKWESANDEYPGSEGEDDEGIGETDITGTVTGIARGFGSHLPLDLGADGFQIEEIPDRLAGTHSARKQGEELDDYDDDNDLNGKYDSGDLADVEQPGANPAAEQDELDETIPSSRFDAQIGNSYK
jgi:hypothetical protein